MAHTRTWDNTDPANGDNASAGAQEIRECKIDVDERMQAEHYWGATGSTAIGGGHIPGKVPVILQDEDAADIVAQGAGTVMLAALNGSVARAADTGVLYVKIGTDGSSTGTWTATNSIDDAAVTFAKLATYDSGWTDASGYKGAHTAFTHGLGALPDKVEIYLSSQSDGICSTTAHWTTSAGGTNYDRLRGTYISYMDATSIYIYMGASYQLDILNRAGTRIISPTTIYIRVIAMT